MYIGKRLYKNIVAMKTEKKHFTKKIFVDGLLKVRQVSLGLLNSTTEMNF